MKKLICLLLLATVLVSCGESENISSSESPQVVTEQEQKETVAPVEVAEEGMTPVYPDELKNGTYSVEVSSSSSMFNITACELTVADGQMTAVMTMSGKGYKWLFMGDGATAETVGESEYIPFEEADGVHRFTVPVSALDTAVSCSAFSVKKEQWYDRKILFRADSLPTDAFVNVNDAESLSISDGRYTAEVTLEGGSGKASVQSPAEITVTDGQITAEIIWNSNNYDYMVVDGKKYLPMSVEENSIFEIPVSAFNRKIAVSADTTAMSTPHEID
nr:hypothetical protein [Ruminococcus sp.]